MRPRTSSVLLLLTSCCWAISVGAEECTTPNRETGDCVDVDACLSITEFISGVSDAVVDEFRSALRSYRCGSGERGPKVCCPKGPIGLADLAGNREQCGIDAVPPEYPWTAALEYDTSRPALPCGGTLISKRYVLTSAHCVKPKLARVTLKGQLKQFNVSTVDVIVHPNYSRPLLTGDIALIRLPAEVERVTPICLPIRDEAKDNKFTLPLAVTGWLLDMSVRGGRPDLVRMNVPVVPNDRCAENYKHLMLTEAVRIHERHICVGEDFSQDFCGRPVRTSLVLTDQVVSAGVARTVLYGVGSFGAVDCKLNLPQVYTRITSYIDWILENAKE